MARAQWSHPVPFPPAKRRRLRDAASWYLAQTGLDCPCRFDVAEVYDQEGRRRINYMISAFF